VYEGKESDMKRWLSIFLVLVLLLALTGCSGKSPEQAVSNAIDAMKDLDDSDELTEQEEEMGKLIFQNLDYEIKSSSEEGDMAVVNADITNIDMGIVFSEMIMEMFTRAFSEALSSEPMTEEETDEMVQELVTELMEKHKDKTVTNSVAIKLNRIDNQWRIELDDKFQNALMGNLFSVVESMNEAFE
jgi:predicted small lipoprotein YifL